VNRVCYFLRPEFEAEHWEQEAGRAAAVRLCRSRLLRRLYLLLPVVAGAMIISATSLLFGFTSRTSLFCSLA
jgi:hypothetical protein